MKCRHCKTELRLPFLDLGSAPHSNAYLSEDGLRAPELWYPLRVMVCEQCWLVQTEDHAGREALFKDDYAYFSSFSVSWLAHAEAFVKMAVGRFDLNSKSQVVEVAANDGYLLQYVQSVGIPCYGVEPTIGTSAAAKAKGIDIVERFFGLALANELALAGRQADLLIANNVLAHVPDINDFVAGFTRLLTKTGVATFEFPHLLRMVQHNQFDTAYHEHYSYLSLTAVERIFSFNGLTVFDVEELPTHGGSLRVFAQRTVGAVRKVTPAVSALRKVETVAGITSANFYRSFQTKAEIVKNQLVEFLIECSQQGKKVGAYGAAAKGNTLLNFAGVRPDLLPYVVDKNPLKQCKFMPGSRIPIVGEAHLKAHKPDQILILPWNLHDEITDQLSYAQAWGGRFVIAIPKLVVVGGAS